MIESEWLNCKDPDKLYIDQFGEFPRPTRKLSLFATGCCRQIWNFITDARCRTAVEVAERCADGLATFDGDEYDVSWEAAQEACDEIDDRNPNSVESAANHAGFLALQAPSDASKPVAWVMTRVDDYPDSFRANHSTLADLFRDVFDNPYRPRKIRREWWTTSIKTLAELIYHDNAWHLMPKLDELLEMVGCDDPEILDHCRSTKPHIKGCWLLDFILEKEPWITETE